MLTAYDTRKILPTRAIEPFRKINSQQLEIPECLPCGKISTPENLQKIGEQTIGHAHLDGNGHVGNAFYAAFIANALPQQYFDRPLIDFRINYSKEALLGETLELFMAETAKDRLVVIGRKPDGISFASELSF